MEYVYAAMLLHRAGKSINEENIKKILSAAGVTPDEVRVKALVAALGEVNIDEAIKSAAPIPMAVTPVTPQSEATATTKEKEEKKKEEKKEEEALEGLGALFG